MSVRRGFALWWWSIAWANTYWDIFITHALRLVRVVSPNGDWVSDGVTWKCVLHLLTVTLFVFNHWHVRIKLLYSSAVSIVLSSFFTSPLQNVKWHLPNEIRKALFSIVCKWCEAKEGFLYPATTVSIPCESFSETVVTPVTRAPVRKKYLHRRRIQL